MNIFISFASEQARLAESIYRKLLAAGFDVFFSSDDIRASSGYDDVIRKAVDLADRLIFLASPQSIEEGRYTLTELRMFSDKWPDPTGRVMTVMVDDVSYDDVPPYLGAVTSALSPQGNVASEVAAVVVRVWPRSEGVFAGHHANVYGALLLALLLGLGMWLLLDGLPSPPRPLELRTEVEAGADAQGGETQSPPGPAGK